MEDERKTAARLTVYVIGVPAPQGSMSAIRTKSGKTIMKHASKKLPEWRNAVVEALEKELTWLYNRSRPWVYDKDLGYQLDVDFFFPRPKSHSKKQRLNPWRYQSPDLDKLVRAVGDALEISGVLGDDARIARLVAEKRYVDPPQNTGAAILLRPLATRSE